MTRRIRLMQEQIEILTRELVSAHEREAAQTQQLQVRFVLFGCLFVCLFVRLFFKGHVCMFVCMYCIAYITCGLLDMG
jgi:hypothetical protein